MRYDVCVFGGCSLDMMFYADENNRYREIADKLVPGGKGANQAIAAARAGAKVAIVTRIGKDKIGDEIFNNLQQNGVFTNNIEIVPGLKNDCAKIYIDNITKDNTIVRETGAIDSFDVEMVKKYAPVFLNSKIVVAQMKAPKEVSEALINFCYENKKTLIVTPCRPEKLRIDENNNQELIDKISFITANRKECETIFNTHNIDECLKKYPNKLIVTLGDEGIAFFDGVEIQHIKAVDVSNILDTTGAGDTFNGNLAYCLTHGYDLKSAIERAQYASAMKIRVETAQQGMPYKEELDNFIREYNLKSRFYAEEFDLAYAGIMEAYELIKDKKITRINTKDDKSFVTESDLIVEKVLIDKIRSRFPNDNFVTEETNNQNKITNRTWVIDPIDGTTHYMKNSIFWAIQLAFVDENDVQFAIIYLPRLQEIYYASKGNGTFLNNKKIVINKPTEISKCIVEFCGTVSKNYEEKKKMFELLLNSENKIANFMHINTCSVAFANLISRRTDCLILSSKKVWDVLPGIMMCKEAGLTAMNYGNLNIYTNNLDIVSSIINDNGEIIA